MKTKIINTFKTLSLDDMLNVMDTLKIIYNEKFSETFVVLVLISSKGNICHTIESETGFTCDYKHSLVGGRGANNVFIPRNVFTVKLKADLIFKYSDE
jgi:hypothetical protein